jgi:hypothetical protein
MPSNAGEQSSKNDEKNNNKKSYIYKTFHSSYIGVTQMVFTFCLTHPLDLFKTNMQASLKKNQNSLEVIREQLRKGPSSFYIAAIPNFSRFFFKELYRSPLRGFLKKFYNDNLPANVSVAYPDLKNVLTGLSLSITDTFVLCPLERVKVWIMTNNDRNKPIRQFFVKDSQPLLKDLFRGLNVSFCRSTISWVSYLTLEERIRLFLCKEFVTSQEDMPISLQILIGTLSGVCNLALTHPFDTIKTQIQKKDATTMSKPFLKTLLDLYRTNGLGGVYSGWQFRLPSYIIVAVITSSNIQKIDKIWNS